MRLTRLPQRRDDQRLRRLTTCQCHGTRTLRMRRCAARITLLEAPFGSHAHTQVIRDGVLCAGLYPQVAVGAEVNGRAEWTVGNSKVAVHPSSVNHGRPNLVKLSPFLLFHEKMLTTQVFIRECSVVSPAVRDCAAHGA